MQLIVLDQPQVMGGLTRADGVMEFEPIGTVINDVREAVDSDWGLMKLPAGV